MTTAAEATPKIREALAKLRLRPDLSNENECADKVLDQLASSIAVHGILQKASRAAATSRGTCSGLDELRSIRKLTLKLAQGIENLGPDARLALGSSGLEQASAALFALADLNGEVVDAHRRLGSAPIAPPANQKADPAEPAITRHAAIIYSRVTGRDPARNNRETDEEGGDFVRFLGAVFNALGLGGSADYRARRLLAKPAKNST